MEIQAPLLGLGRSAIECLVCIKSRSFILTTVIGKEARVKMQSDLSFLCSWIPASFWLVLIVCKGFSFCHLSTPFMNNRVISYRNISQLFFKKKKKSHQPMVKRRQYKYLLLVHQLRSCSKDSSWYLTISSEKIAGKPVLLGFCCCILFVALGQQVKAAFI